MHYFVEAAAFFSNVLNAALVAAFDGLA